MALLKIVPLGGCAEIGKNCTVVEQNDEIIIVDCGISFPHEEHHGVDIVIPDFAYLEENAHKVKAVVITHAHEDHIGSLPFLLERINVPVYASPLTEAFVRRRMDERHKSVDLEIRPLKYGQKTDIGLFTVEPVRLTHSIPENSALAIWTAHGIVLFSGDYKFDQNPVDRKTSDIKRLAELGEEGVLMLLTDSTNVERPGWSPSESDVKPGLVDIFTKAEGRVLVTTFSSQIHRMQQVCDAARETGRKVSVAGRRMDQTFQMCRKMGYLHVPDNIYFPIEDINQYRQEEVAILVTGSQGEQMAALSQMSRGEYSRLKVARGDTVVYSARAIPGNEGGIWRVVNRLTKLGADVITDYRSPIHVSGHASQEEIKMMVRLTQPFYVAPVHGEVRHQKLMTELLTDLGQPGHRIFSLENGDTLTIDDQKAWIGEPVPAGELFIDQHSGAIVTPDVLRQRTALANEGVFVVSVKLDPKRGEILSQPLAKVSGFTADDEAIEDVLEDVEHHLGSIKPDTLRDVKKFEDELADIVRRMTWRRTSQKPVVVTVVTTP